MRVCGIGGGHGLAASLRAARIYASNVSAVVTVADDGGSSGRLTRELGIPPPGDIRNCLVALSDNDELSELFQHRFDAGLLTGHTVGNLVIAALTERLGDFGAAVKSAGELLGAAGRVYPATVELVGLAAHAAGRVVSGQVAVAQSEHIQATYLDPPDPASYPPAVEAIRSANQVILGPGSLFTSLIATLLVPGIGDALRETGAQRVFVCNARMQKGETEGLKASDHIAALMAHVGADAVDVVLVHSPAIRGDGVELDGGLGFSGIEIVEADVAKPSGTHDPEKLAAVLARLSK